MIGGAREECADEAEVSSLGVRLCRDVEFTSSTGTLRSLPTPESAEGTESVGPKGFAIAADVELFVAGAMEV